MVTETVSIKRALSKTITALVSSTSNIYFKYYRTITAIQTTTASIIKTIGKIVKATPSSSVSIAIHQFYYKVLTYATTTTVTAIKTVSTTLTLTFTASVRILRSLTKQLTAISSIVVRLFVNAIPKFGADFGKTLYEQIRKRLIYKVSNREVSTRKDLNG
jgi:hypothetical protein